MKINCKNNIPIWNNPNWNIIRLRGNQRIHVFHGAVKRIDLVEVCDIVAAVEQNANPCFIKNSFLEAKDGFIMTEAFCNLTRFTFFTKFGLL